MSMQPDRVVLTQEELASIVGDRWSKEELSKVANLLADGDGKFPAGNRTVASELVKAVQKERMIAAMIRAGADVGYRDLSVQDVLDRAGVSRPTFYEHFANKEECFATSYESIVNRLRTDVENTLDGSDEESWNEQIRGALTAILSFLVEDPKAGRTLLIEARAATPEVARCRDDLLNHFIDRLERSVRKEFEKPTSRIAAAGVVGGIESVLFARVHQNQTEDLDTLLPSLMYFAVMPFAGHETASRELG